MIIRPYGTEWGRGSPPLMEGLGEGAAVALLWEFHSSTSDRMRSR